AESAWSSGIMKGCETSHCLCDSRQYPALLLKLCRTPTDFHSYREPAADPASPLGDLPPRATSLTGRKWEFRFEPDRSPGRRSGLPTPQVSPWRLFPPWRLFEQVPHPTARPGEVQAAGIALFQDAHHLADLLGAGSPHLLDDGRDRRLGLSLAQLLRQELLDDGNLGGLLIRLRLAASPLIKGMRFAPLLDHPLQLRRYLGVQDRLPGGDVGLLESGADEPQRRKARLVLGLEGSLDLCG